jgi:pimeloyl-ACP methyl ester carboxylesterase
MAREMIPVGADALWAEDSGGDGEPLVLLHPGIGDLRVWDAVWGPLTASFRVIRYDVRGYGGSPPATQSYDWIGDLVAVLDHFGVESAHLCGNSNGGATALGLAVAWPQRVRSLVLLAPGISGFDYPPEPELEERAREVGATGDQEVMIDFLLDLWCSAGREPFVREMVEASATIDDEASAFFQPLPEVFDRLGEVTAPTVVMVGDRDPVSMIAGCEAAAERIPGARFLRLAGVDHLPQLRVPDLVVEAIRDVARTAGETA